MGMGMWYGQHNLVAITGPVTWHHSLLVPDNLLVHRNMVTTVCLLVLIQYQLVTQVCCLLVQWYSNRILLVWVNLYNDHNVQGLVQQYVTTVCWYKTVCRFGYSSLLV